MTKKKDKKLKKLKKAGINLIDLGIEKVERRRAEAPKKKQQDSEERSATASETGRKAEGKRASRTKAVSQAKEESKARQRKERAPKREQGNAASGRTELEDRAKRSSKRGRSRRQQREQDSLKLKGSLEGSSRQGRRPSGKKAKSERRPAARLDESRIFEGVFSQHQKGFGFVTVEGREQDIFIPADRTGEAFHRDTVRVYLEKEADPNGAFRAEGRIIEVRDHEIKELIGIYHSHKSFGFVIPDDRRVLSDIYVQRGESLGAATGDKVVVSLKSYGDRQHKPEGIVTEVLGRANDKGVDITSAVRSSQVPYAFPEAVEEELKNIPGTVRKRELSGRRDFRGELCVTIDGDDSKDFDDAVSLSFDKESGLYELGVHIADVAEYVKEGSALDTEAKLRGTSIYLPDRVIPMLPEKLSNGICSLNEGVDRLTLSCIMKIDAKGEIRDYDICEGVIRSRRRLTYKYVYSLLTDKTVRSAEKDKELLRMLKLMLKLSKLIRRKREREGSIDFDLPESVIKLDRNGRVREISRYEINDANRLIEDFMLSANETVAREFEKRKLPFLYRVHEGPSDEKAEELISLVQGLGFSIRKPKDGLRDPRELSKLLKKTEGSPESVLIERVALRSMSKAKYMTECLGHYGLSKKYYTHFTSPIRRYPDLQIHRIIKEAIRNGGGLKPRRKAHYDKLLPKVAELCSDNERRADELERDCDKLKKCEYMRHFVGERFEAVISGVTGYGFYAELPNTCEGMVHVSTLTDDHYVFDDKRLRLVGERRGRVFALGDRVAVVVTAADKLERTIDFRLCYE